MRLRAYHAKRDFARTQEPKGSVTRRPAGRRFLYVIQKHAARRLHYDFRLELDGVLKSWALPKGVPLHSGERRLAVQVEDHPVDYAKFEGTIPAGNYGAGTVMVWDAGICETSDDPRQGLKAGKVSLLLEGQKLKGEWLLIRMKPKDDDENAWLIIKTEKDAKAISARAEDRSVLTGKTMKQIAATTDATWESDRQQKPGRRRVARARANR